MPRWKTIWVTLLSLSLWVTSSSALILCVHEGHAGFEPTWASCCESAACCSAAATRADQDSHGHVGEPDGCRDYVLGLDTAWEAGPDAPQLAPAALSPAPARAAWWVAPSWTLGSPPRGVPPPQRAQRSPIRRC